MKKYTRGSIGHRSTVHLVFCTMELDKSDPQETSVQVSTKNDADIDSNLDENDTDVEHEPVTDISNESETSNDIESVHGNYPSIDEDNDDVQDDTFDELSEDEPELQFSDDDESVPTDTSISEHEMEEEQEEPKEDVFDKIIDAFTVKRRKAIIDQEHDDDVVDYEDSERRLFIMAIVLATIFSIIATILLIIQVPNWSTDQVTIYQPFSRQEFQRKIHPYVIIFFWNGEMEAFKQNGTYLEHSWSFQVPKVQDETGHLFYSKSGQLSIMSSDGKQNIVSLAKGYQNVTHYKVPNSQIPHNFYYSARFVQVGHLVWIFGGRDEHIQVSQEAIGASTAKFGHQVESLIWNTNRNVYYPGPDLPDFRIGRGYPVALNRTHVIILQIDRFSECLQGWIYAFDSFLWTTLNNCICQLEEIDIWVDYFDELQFDVNGASSVGKDGTTVEVLVMINEHEFSSWTWNWISFKLVLVDLRTLSSTEIEHDLEVSLPKDRIEIVSSLDIIYLLHATEEHGPIMVYFWNGSKLEYLQKLDIYPTLPITKMKSSLNYFHAISSVI